MYSFYRFTLYSGVDRQVLRYTGVHDATHRVSFIYDVHTEGEGCQVQVDACGLGKGGQLHVEVHTENI